MPLRVEGQFAFVHRVLLVGLPGPPPGFPAYAASADRNDAADEMVGLFAFGSRRR